MRVKNDRERGEMPSDAYFSISAGELLFLLLPVAFVFALWKAVSKGSHPIGQLPSASLSSDLRRF
jgi:hypothetical protein